MLRPLLGAMDELDILSRLATSLSIGLLVGLERGWQTRDETEGHRAAGLRTFGLAGLAGGVAGALSPTIGPIAFGFLFLGHAAAFIAFGWLEAKREETASATTVVSGLLTFLLGAYAVVGEIRVAVAAAVAMTLLLALRQQLHGWVKSLTWPEIRAGLILLAMTFLLLPVLPNRTIDPWDAINPSRIWLLAIMIAAISFGGYVAVRVFGDRLGVVMAAIAGGLASSTATTLTLARLARDHPQSSKLISAGILATGAVMVIRVGVVAGALNAKLIGSIAPPVAAAAAVLAVGTLLLLAGTRGDERPKLEMSSPLDLSTTIRLSLFIAVVLAAARIFEDTLGASGVFMVAAVSGIADVDAVTISMTEYAKSDAQIPVAVTAIGLAVAVNTIAKSVMAAWIGGWRIGLTTIAGGLLAIAAGFAAIHSFDLFDASGNGPTP